MAVLTSAQASFMLLLMVVLGTLVRTGLYSSSIVEGEQYRLPLRLPFPPMWVFQFMQDALPCIIVLHNTVKTRI